jgi:transcription-repair coupling factor (superfamily II helicase)
LIATLDELGSGFVLATHDLEIRGAGELLGDEQSGQIHEIGFALYMELLERAVTALKSGREPELERPLHHGPEVELHVPALLPEAYLPDVHTRLVMYKRIASAPTLAELDELRAETIDRFGVSTDQFVETDVARARAQAQSLATALIRLGASPARIFVGIAEGGTSRSGDRAEIYLDY